MKPKKKTVVILVIISLILLIALTAYIIWENKNVQITEITVKSGSLPASFDGYRIAHISDLHSAEFGKDNQKLLEMLSDIAPDIIVMTGDLFDPRHGDMAVCVDFSREAVKIAPTYMVSGNHDEIYKRGDSYTFEVLAPKLSEVGVTVLRGERVYLERDGEHIALLGIDDPMVLIRQEFDRDYFERNEEPRYTISKAINALPKSDDSFAILLAHRPDFFDLYASYGVDLVFCGHAHGGQFRLPLIGGLYAPGQGIFPKYTSGLHTLDGTNMIVSRGLGNASFPFRFNNPPEIVVATLDCE